MNQALQAPAEPQPGFQIDPFNALVRDLFGLTREGPNRPVPRIEGTTPTDLRRHYCFEEPGDDDTDE